MTEVFAWNVRKVLGIALSATGINFCLEQIALISVMVAITQIFERENVKIVPITAKIVPVGLSALNAKIQFSTY